jgi:hypothetical protein
VVASKDLIRIAANGMDEWSRKDARTQREKTEGVIQMQWSHGNADKSVREANAVQPRIIERLSGKSSC